jgi:ribose 5-phosphate isomerase B
MELIMGSDHGGWELAAHLAERLRQAGHTVRTVGATGPESVDYPAIAETVGRAVTKGEAQLGILVCGSGIGVCIAANKVPGVRAALVHDELTARLSRQHNDANVLCLGGRLIGPVAADAIVDAWLGTAFEGGRHSRRIDQIHAIEQAPTGSAC